MRSPVCLQVGCVEVLEFWLELVPFALCCRGHGFTGLLIFIPVASRRVERI